METVTCLRSTDVPHEALGPLLSEYLALDRVRNLRRLLLVRCGSLALATAVLGPLVGWLSALARSVMVAGLLVPPVCAWVVERRADSRLSRRLSSIKTESGTAAPSQAE